MLGYEQFLVPSHGSDGTTFSFQRRQDDTSSVA